jgi:LPXTG-motif cell wall-anchored protein
MRTRFLIATLLVLALAPIARADGLPIADAGAPAVIGGADVNGRLVALPARGRTVVARIGGSVFASRLIDGRYTVPVVALDRTASGLSTDGSTLVLINPRRTFPRARTSFVVLDATNLRTRQHVVLDGDFSFDALSPDGTRMFLVHYLSRRDPTRYEVRALDVPSGKLLPAPIVDKSEPDERMAGFPITRETTADGRWAYTLYDGAGEEPFVHALDTVDGEAHCIDLAMLSGRQDLYDLRLDLGPGHGALAVVDGAQKLALIDTSDFEPVAAKSVAADAERPSSGSVGWLSVLLGLSGALVAGVAYVLVRRRKKSEEATRNAAPTHPVAHERRSSLRA